MDTILVSNEVLRQWIQILIELTIEDTQEPLSDDPWEVD